MMLLLSYPSPCPVCSMEGGFHDPVVHGQHQVPRELIKPKGKHQR